MKKILLISASLIFGIAQAQSDNVKQEINNELRFNALYTIFSFPEVSYERTLSDESSFGISAAVALDADINFTYLISPFFRIYLQDKKRAAGFFIEANAGLFSQSTEYYSLGGGYIETNNEFGYGLGLALGKKFLTKNNFVVEILAGLGRNFNNSDYYQLYPRVGLSMGKRF